MAESWLEVRMAFGAAREGVLASGVFQQALEGAGFEGFCEDELGQGVLVGYVPSARYSPGVVECLACDFGLDGVGVTPCEVEMRNWNCEWERQVQPVVLHGARGSVRVRSAFHDAAAGDVVVTPQMAFGTGHHATTAMVAEALLDIDLAGLRVLDMGCGTGLLGLVAARGGALAVDAIDYDENAVRNARDNVRANGAEGQVRVLHGSFDAIPRGAVYDLIVANMTLNLLTAHMSLLALHLRGGGALIASGLLARDAVELSASAGRCGLREAGIQRRGEWVCQRFVKGDKAG